MIPPELFDAEGKPMPERRKGARREDDLRDDALDPAVLLGYEQWAGMIWRHRGKILFAFTVLSGAVGCVAGYLGRQHDLERVNERVTANSDRITKVEQLQAEQRQMEPVKMLMLCSLTRRIDPQGVPAECNQTQRGRP
jgi:hypothetical protein